MLCISQFHLRPAPPPPWLLWGICPPCQSQGWGICKFCTARGLGICQPRAIPELLTCTRFPIRIFNYTEGFTEKKADWLMHYWKYCLRTCRWDKYFCLRFMWHFKTENWVAPEPHVSSGLSNISRMSASSLLGHPHIEKQMKAQGRRLGAFIDLRCLHYREEAQNKSFCYSLNEWPTFIIYCRWELILGFIINKIQFSYKIRNSLVYAEGNRGIPM